MAGLATAVAKKAAVGRQSPPLRLAALYNAGDYDSEHVPEMLTYAKDSLHDISDGTRAFGHWHYTYLYYSQVVYRQGDELVEALPRSSCTIALSASSVPMDFGRGKSIHPVYVTACNLIMLQLGPGLLTDLPTLMVLVASCV